MTSAGAPEPSPDIVGSTGLSGTEYAFAADALETAPQLVHRDASCRKMIMVGIVGRRQGTVIGAALRLGAEERSAVTGRVDLVNAYPEPLSSRSLHQMANVPDGS